MQKQNFIATVRRAFATVTASAMLFTAAWSGMGGSMPVHAEEAKGTINVSYHTQAEISARIKSDGISMKDVPSYVVNPQLEPPYDNAGVLTPDTLNNALKTLNQIRYIAGLQDNVTLNEEYNRETQAAALVNYANKKLSHSPSKPSGMFDSMYQLGYSGASSSNIAMASWNRSLNQTIAMSWMNDGDSSNIDRVGHRRWILNPAMQQTGFGAVYGPSGTYSAVYAFDRSNRSAWETQVAWPAQNMPIQYFGKEFPWSISMGKSVDKNSVHVTLKRINDGMTWNFSSGSSNGYFNVDNAGYGQTGCIIFRPENITGYQAGDTFEVAITGSGINLSYTVNFFDPDNVEPAELIVEPNWTAADALLDAVPEGGAADILTGCVFTVPAETLNKISGRNILCALHIDSDLVFSIFGADVPPAQSSWDVAVSYKTGIPQTVLTQIKKDAAAIRAFDLTDAGALPASINVHIVWGTENIGKQAVLYSYDDASGNLSEVGRFAITEYGQTMFTIGGGSGHYIAVVSK